MKMTDLMHEMYSRDKLTADVTGGIDGGFDKVSAAIKDTIAQNVLDTATWFLSQKERELGISNDTDDVRLRRARVLAANLMSGKCSIELLQGILNGFGLDGNITVGDMTLVLELTGCEDSPYAVNAMKEIDRAAPAHLGIEWTMTSRQRHGVNIAIIPVTSKLETLNPLYEDIVAGCMFNVGLAGYLTSGRREIIEAEVITPAAGGGSGDIVGEVTIKAAGVVDEGVIGVYKEVV